MKTESKISVGSLSIVKAVDSFKSAFFSDSTICSISSSNATKKDKCDKGYYDVSFMTAKAEDVPYFLEETDYTDQVKSFFADKLKRDIRFLELNWSFNDKSFDMSIHIRF